MQQALEQPDVIGSEFVSFFVGDQSFCLEISQIREIRRWSPATVLPHAPDYVLGVINLRGSVIPVFDLSARLGFGKLTPDERNVIIIAAIGDQMIGMLVDSVSEILSLDPDAIQPRPNIGDEEVISYIQGFASVDDDITRLIDLEAILSPSSKLVAE
ncbi:chemotaxis protein CheW [Litoreibacter roseus]|uniref:Chemotaxis protein CheW n=1 Tax=Litoreibacter roseus TaxID=2601869 RepID=A0A6N6JEM9_9RHOB|nr:chemotaxis protein CheW [Litoreibacter roseus]GFE64811.1 chemotaxis protein CheW [Litoreibacter roseus]